MTRDTSIEAFDSIENIEPTLNQKVFKLIKDGAGRTCDEIEIALNMRHQTISSRITHLTKIGAIVDSGARRPTRSGRNAIVWIKK